MRIGEMFRKDIDRDINGVIQAGQVDEQAVFQELDEYVMTEELAENFSTFFAHYARSLQEPTGKMGVWISGFFGSGKSHFLKMLSYLLGNRSVHGRNAVDFFRDKEIDPELLHAMEQAASVDSDTVLFNIDSKSSTSVAQQQQKIVDVFLKVFNEHLGYSGTNFIAEMERMLEEEGQYAPFKEAFLAQTGTRWEDTRQSVLLKQKGFLQAMQAVGYEEEAARTFLKTTKDTFEITSEALAKRIAAYCRKRGRKYRMIFLIDEVGQYIGDDTQLMLNLQTVVEDIGKHTNGQAWVIVTSQEKIDALTHLRGDDFSKIQGRFHTKLNLSSANTDEVIKRRLLAKNEVAEQTLTLEYEARQQSLKNMLSFDNRTAAVRSGYKSAEDFAAMYPFVPYQVDLLQKVFDKIRRQGEAGKHLSKGERSLLNAFQEAAQQMQGESTRKLARFSSFYKTVESVLDTTVKNTIRKAAQREELNEFDLTVLKTLYMIKNIDELPATLANVTTLLIDDLDTSKHELAGQVGASLLRLQRQMLIQQNADQTYLFLSDEEQEINREIKNVLIEEERVVEKMGREFYEHIYAKNRYKAQSGHEFEYTKKFNAYLRGTSAHALTLQVFTSDVTPERAALEANSGVLVMHLAESTAPDAYEYALQIHDYVLKKESQQKSAIQKRILDDRRADVSKFAEKGAAALEEACKQATFYVLGQVYQFTGEVSSQIDRAFDVLVRNTFTKLSYLDQRVEGRQAAQTITAWAKNGLPASTTEADGRNHRALRELEQYLEHKQNGHVRPTLKNLVEDFTRAPYGWSEYDVAGLVALLLHEGKVKLIYVSERLLPDHPKFAERLTKTADREKVIAEVEVAVPQEVRNKVFRLSKSFFQQFTLGETYDAIAGLLRDKITGVMDAPLKEIEHKRQQEQPHFPYPGQQVVQRLRRLVQELLDKRESEALVLAFIEREEALEDWFDDFEELQGFYQGRQIGAFDEAVQLLMQKKTDLLHASDDAEVQRDREQIEKILRLEKPYRQMSDLPNLMAHLKSKLAGLFAQKRQELEPRTLQMRETMQAWARDYQDDQELTDLMQRGQAHIERTLQELARTDSIGELLMYANLAEDKLHALDDELQGLLTSRQSSVAQPPQPEAKPVYDPGLKPIQTVHELTAAQWVLGAATELRIESEADLDRVLAQLREQMQAQLQQGAVIVRK